jgi:molybdopterin-guanine dinucleotide biosynthesis protein A
VHFTTIILAGGQSSRMGSNKALILYHGKPLVQYSIDLAKSFSSDILISSNSHDLDHFGHIVVPDILEVKAPLAGIHAGLKASGTPWNLILTCDMPNITADLVNRLQGFLDKDVQLVLPTHNGFTEPLCGFYHRDMILLIEENYNAGRISLLDLPGQAKHRFISMDTFSTEELSSLFRNMNERKDLLLDFLA